MLLPLPKVQKKNNSFSINLKLRHCIKLAFRTSILWIYSSGFPSPASVVQVPISLAKLDYLLFWKTNSTEMDSSEGCILDSQRLIYSIFSIKSFSDNPTGSLMLSILFETSIVPLNTNPNRVMGSWNRFNNVLTDCLSHYALLWSYWHACLILSTRLQILKMKWFCCIPLSVSYIHFQWFLLGLEQTTN